MRKLLLSITINNFFFYLINILKYILVFYIEYKSELYFIRVFEVFSKLIILISNL